MPTAEVDPLIGAAGAHETALQPVLWALNLATSHALPVGRALPSGGAGQAAVVVVLTRGHVTSGRQHADGLV